MLKYRGYLYIGLTKNKKIRRIGDVIIKNVDKLYVFTLCNLIVFFFSII